MQQSAKKLRIEKYIKSLNLNCAGSSGILRQISRRREEHEPAEQGGRQQKLHHSELINPYTGKTL
jgi:hypothetical protein